MKKILGTIIVLFVVGFMAHTIVVQAATSGPQCSDGIDNDGDSLIDIYDPQCHIDGDVTNIDSFDPSIEQEIDTTAGCVGCGPKPVVVNIGGIGGGTGFICSDGIDNDKDGLVDGNDPGCHLDNDMSKVYNLGDLDESNPAPVVIIEEPKPEVLGVSIAACGPEVGRPCILQKTGGMTLERIKANQKALVIARQEKNSIRIPKLHVNKAILQLPTIDALRSEFWVLPWTSTPDKGGNTVLVAHSYNLVKGKYSKSTLFNLDTMEKGDTIEMTWKGKTYTYEVIDKMLKVSPDNISVEDQTEAPMLTIYGCGRYDNTYRNVIRAVLK